MSDSTALPGEQLPTRRYHVGFPLAPPREPVPYHVFHSLRILSAELNWLCRRRHSFLTDLLFAHQRPLFFHPRKPTFDNPLPTPHNPTTSPDYKIPSCHNNIPPAAPYTLRFTPISRSATRMFETTMSSVGPGEYMQSLSSLVPYCNPQLPPVIPHLLNILSICKRPWIYEFLFNDDPTHLHIFTAPLYRRNAFSCDIAVTRFQPPIIASPYGLRFDSSVVFVPAYSVGHISVGFGIEEKSYTCTQSFDGCEQPKNVNCSVDRHNELFRYIRDDRAGTLVMVYDYGDCYHIEYVTHLSSTCRQRSSTRYKRDFLRDILRSEGSIDEGSLLPAMVCLQVVDEFRQCPTCGAMPDQGCRCSLNLVRPKHSLDFLNHARQMSTHTGEYAGMVHLAKFEDGESNTHITLGSRISLRGSEAPNLVRRLTEWAVERDLQRVPLDPMASLMPAAGQTGTLLGCSQASMAAGPLTSTSQPVFARRSQLGIAPESVQVSGGIAVDSVCVSEGEIQALYASQGFDTAGRPFEALQGQRFTGMVGPSKQESTMQFGQSAGLVQGDMGPDPGSSLPLTDFELQRFVKIERKKQKNRESAHRSNMKKKLENDERKAELQRLKELETRLRAREQQLREENLRFRRYLQDPF